MCANVEKNERVTAANDLAIIFYVQLSWNNKKENLFIDVSVNVYY